MFLLQNWEPALQELPGKGPRSDLKRQKLNRNNMQTSNCSVQYRAVGTELGYQEGLLRMEPSLMGKRRQGFNGF